MILTDFEELRVLDCRYKPDIRTALGNAKLKYHYPDYADKEKFRDNLLPVLAGIRAEWID